MHRYIAKGGTIFNHNGDLSGDTLIVVEAERMKHVCGVVVVNIPAQDMLDFIADYVRMRKITALEQATSEELLNE
jgi:hypothetical protein